ncbi:YoaP-like protein [Lachnotalea glycerini]|uniref:GNAT family N-acetyltransferase n=1 Tax=Lachnotalea glycerini TaxID=1763509 RepID=A0A318ETB5_9FIRM|nr:GNAT family N-acetyltransferase [Lachnotalea glycerini]OYP46519.1 GNAT family N-acetyltransferase [Lachnotalea glycerini]PXV95512.1 YoaP-like protein [Lachnotalea glycerini]RDY32832.1 GNAT family N-acetyltransferase [Lachnotalea glycerini]
MEFVRLTKDNIEQEHICCAIANNKDSQVSSKKKWLEERLKEGLVFLKGNVRGKCFIEYIPAEYAWAPVEADNYIYINCFWVSGQFKGQGNSNELLNTCIEDAKQQGKKGLVILSADKKRPYLSDPKYLKYKGFEVVDTAMPYYELLCLKFDKNSDSPKFMKHVKNPHIDKEGFVLYYSSQCPFIAKYVPLIEAIAKNKGLKFEAIHLNSAKQAKMAPAPFTTYSMFYNGDFVTNEIFSEKKFEQMIEKVNEN